MKKLAIIVGLLLFLSICACGGTVKQYEKSNVEILSIQSSLTGKTELIYQPILDSMYYCPGATIRREGDRQKVSFVRCEIKEKCTVDLKAEMIAQGQWKIVILDSPDKIDLVFSDGEIQLPQK